MEQLRTDSTLQRSLARQEQIEKILRLDTLCIAARILAILFDTQRREEFVEQKTPEAQDLLNLLQAVTCLSLTGFPYPDDHLLASRFPAPQPCPSSDSEGDVCIIQQLLPSSSTFYSSGCR